MSYNHKIGWIIRSARESRGYSQDYMAEMLQVCQSTYANIESGKVVLSIERLMRITEILGVDIHDLIDKGFAPVKQMEDDHKTILVLSDTKEVYDQLIRELKNEIDFLRSMVKEKQAS